MEREIKFRAKSIDNSEWAFGVIHNDGMTLFPVSVDMKTICQFTGRHDNNGKEIYSGDLLKDQDGVLYEVWYSEDTSAFMAEMINPSNDMVDILGGYDTERCFEVIGNVYDNYELLEE